MTRIMIVDCVPAESVETFARFGVPPLWQIEQKMMHGLDATLEFETVFAADTSAPLPGTNEIAEFDGMLWTGTPLSVTDDVPEMQRQVSLMADAFETTVPIFGICGGLQVAVVAAGGKVDVNPAGLESPFARSIELTAEGREHPMMQGRQGLFDAVCDHVDTTLELPTGSRVLAANANCTVQALAMPTAGSEFWGVQYHPDFSVQHLEAIASYRGEQWIELGWLQDAGHLEYLRSSFRRLREGEVTANWGLGVGLDVLDDQRRQSEVSAWLQHRVNKDNKLEQ